jgi:hypothetical protein
MGECETDTYDTDTPTERKAETDRDERRGYTDRKTDEETYRDERGWA